jgi:hypothetical protein
MVVQFTVNTINSNWPDLDGVGAYARYRSSYDTAVLQPMRPSAD